MKKNPLVSVIIPSYNRAEYITRAIRSGLNQTHKNMEIIVIDDASTDNTEQIVKGIKDKRLKYYKNKKNMGAPHCRNLGISLSKGDYINFLDDDDELFPIKVELQLKKFRESKDEKLGIVVADIHYKRKDIAGVVINRKRGNLYKNLLRRHCVVGTSAMFIKKGVFKKIKFDEKLKSRQEYDLMIQISKKWHFDYVPKILSRVHDSKNHHVFNFKKRKNSVKKIWEKYEEEYKKQGKKFYLEMYCLRYYHRIQTLIGEIFGENTFVLCKRIMAKYKKTLRSIHNFEI